MPKQRKELGYKPARVVKGKRLHVSFWAFDVVKGKNRRKRLYFDYITDPTTALAEARACRDDINRQLADGDVIQPPEFFDKPENKDTAALTWAEAMTIAIEEKSHGAATATKQLYGSIGRVLEAWLYSSGNAQVLLPDVKTSHVSKFFEYLRTEHKTKHGKLVENQTYNNYLQHIRTFFNVFVNREDITRNPATGVKALRVTESRNVAYSKQQKEKLREAITETNPQLWVFCQFIYYTLARPIELQKLRVADVRADDVQIVAKHGKTRVTRYPKITPGLQKVVEAMRLDTYPSDYLLFSSTGTPGHERHQLGENYFTRKHRDVLDALGFGDEYSLYSWKHTGVVDLSRAGVKDFFIKQQGGWTDEKSFNKYMRSLGLYTNEELVNKAPEL